MARVRKEAKKPRLRRMVPLSPAKRAQAEPKKAARLPKRVGARAASPLKKLSFLANNPVGKALLKVGSILRRVIVPNYVIESWRELRQVTWPGRREARRLTLAVFTFAVVFGLAIALLDKGLDVLFRKLIVK